MKFKTTQRDINYNYAFVIRVGYCSLYDLLRSVSPVAYTSGIYGWNSDIYDLSELTGYNACLVTGYRPFGNIAGNYERNKKYEAKAAQIIANNDIHWDKKKIKLRQLLKKLALEYIEEYRREV